MPKGIKYIRFLIEDREKILDVVDKISHKMQDYIYERSKSKFLLFYKYLTHSDLGTFGKATDQNSLDKNLLYYMTENEMLEIEKNTGAPFQTAHQSCIGLTNEWYKKTNTPNPRDCDPYLINDFCNVYIVNETMKYFTPHYTKLVFEKLSKSISHVASKQWQFDKLDVKLDDGDYTPIQLHCAVHGLGMKKDIEFHKLRHHLFKGDTFLMLYETNESERNIFLMFDKNPVFFSVIGEINKAYENYQHRLNQRIVSKCTAMGIEINTEGEVTRKNQNAWRQMLAREMMGYTTQDDYVFCPFTYISANFKELGSLFVASHIKGFSDPDTKENEKYDINNGLLLCANADALFDKHIISINENKELEFSFLMKNEFVLKQQLLLLQPVFQPLLNPHRMKYLSHHYKLFLEAEQKRRTEPVD